MSDDSSKLAKILSENQNSAQLPKLLLSELSKNIDFITRLEIAQTILQTAILLTLLAASIVAVLCFYG